MASYHSYSATGPYSSSIASSRHSHMRELRVQHAGRPYRILYAFDPRRIRVAGNLVRKYTLSYKCLCFKGVTLCY
jgi:hypothetical protein